MDWNALKTKDCPRCGLDLEPSTLTGMYSCPDKENCNFKITEEKFTKILEQRGGKTIDDYEENLSALNNL